jgi:hypothetical protein
MNIKGIHLRQAVDDYYSVDDARDGGSPISLAYMSTLFADAK